MSLARLLVAGVVLQFAAPGALEAQSTDACCRGPQAPHMLTMCSPAATELTTRILTEGLEISFDAPPREQTTLLTPMLAVDRGDSTELDWGIPDGNPLPASLIEISGSYLAIEDQRIEVAILQVNVDSDSGVVGTDLIRVAWASVFRPEARAEFDITPGTADRPLQFVRIPSPGAPPDTTIVPGVRITFHTGALVRRGWSAVFDVEDFEGFHVWRWASDPNQEPRVVGTYNKLQDSQRPREDWPNVEPDARRFAFLDRFVIDGNVYHYAVTTFDQGFDRIRGGSLGGVPFDSPLQDEGCPAQLRVDFLRPPPEEFDPVQAVPNPYRQVDCIAADPLSTCSVRFIRMPTRGTLLIFTLAGDLVREFSHPEDASNMDPPGTLRWNTQNTAGQEVASGIYIYRIVDLTSGQESFGRLAIIR
jgi:hypothetical protein